MANVLIVSYSSTDSAVVYAQQFFEGLGDTVTHAVDTTFDPSTVVNYDLVVLMRLQGGNSTSKNKALQVLNYDTPILGSTYAFYGADIYTNNWESESQLVEGVYNLDIQYTGFTLTKRVDGLNFENNQFVTLFNSPTYSNAYKSPDPSGRVVGAHHMGASMVTYEKGATLSSGSVLSQRVALYGLLHNFHTPSTDSLKPVEWIRGWLLGYEESTISGDIVKNDVAYSNCKVKVLREPYYDVVAEISPVNGYYSIKVPSSESFTVICEDLDQSTPLHPLVATGVTGEVNGL